MICIHIQIYLIYHIPCCVNVNGMGIVDGENAVGLLGYAECRTSYPTLL